MKIRRHSGLARSGWAVLAGARLASARWAVSVLPCARRLSCLLACVALSVACDARAQTPSPATAATNARIAADVRAQETANSLVALKTVVAVAADIGDGIPELEGVAPFLHAAGEVFTLFGVGDSSTAILDGVTTNGKKIDTLSTRITDLFEGQAAVITATSGYSDIIGYTSAIRAKRGDVATYYQQIGMGVAPTPLGATPTDLSATLGTAIIGLSTACSGPLDTNGNPVNLGFGTSFLNSVGDADSGSAEHVVTSGLYLYQWMIEAINTFQTYYTITANASIGKRPRDPNYSNITTYASVKTVVQSYIDDHKYFAMAQACSKSLAAAVKYYKSWPQTQQNVTKFVQKQNWTTIPSAQTVATALATQYPYWDWFAVVYNPVAGFENHYVLSVADPVWTFFRQGPNNYNLVIGYTQKNQDYRQDVWNVNCGWYLKGLQGPTYDGTTQSGGAKSGGAKALFIYTLPNPAAGGVPRFPSAPVEDATLVQAVDFTSQKCGGLWGVIQTVWIGKSGDVIDHYIASGNTTGDRSNDSSVSSVIWNQGDPYTHLAVAVSNYSQIADRSAYFIQNLASSEYLGASRGSVYAGNVGRIGGWQLNKASDGYFYVVSQTTGEFMSYLDVASNSPVGISQLPVDPASPRLQSFQWRLRWANGVPDGYYTLSPRTDSTVFLYSNQVPPLAPNAPPPPASNGKPGDWYLSIGPKDAAHVLSAKWLLKSLN